MSETERMAEARFLLTQIERAGLSLDELRALTEHGGVCSTPLVRDYVARVRLLYHNSDTAATYETGWRLLERVYGHWPVDAVTRTHVERLLEAARQRAQLRETDRTKRRAAKGRAEHAGHGHGAVRNAFYAIRAVFRRAETDGLLSHGNPTSDLHPPKRRPTKRRPLNQRDLEQVYEVAATTGDDPLLDALLVRTAVETGARRDGLVSLSLSDLSVQRQTVQLKEKNQKTREQPITRRLFEELLELARQRGSTAPRDPVFRYRNGDPLTERRFDYLFSKRLQAAYDWADEVGVTMHFIRHTVGKRIERIAGRAVARDFLGHAEDTTTDLYTRACPPEVVRAWEQMMGERHPLADEEASW